MIRWTPAVYRLARSVMPANAASVSTSVNVARAAASDSALPASVPPTPPVSTRSTPSSDVTRSATAALSPYAPIGMPPPIALPIVTMSGSSDHACVQPPGPAENVCVSSLISSVPAARVTRADAVEVALLGQDDAHVRERRLHQHRGHVAVGQLPLEPDEVVVLGDPAGERDVGWGADVARPRDATSVVGGDDERLVDGAVVAVAVHEDPWTAGDRSAQPEGPAVGVGGGQREAPPRRAEAARQLGSDNLGVLGRQHRRRPTGLGKASRDRRHHRAWRVSRHRPGVAEREVDELVAVEVGHPGARRAGQVQREAAGALRHPRHRHAPEQVVGGRVGGCGPRVARDVLGALPVEQRGEPVSVDHGATVDVNRQVPRDRSQRRRERPSHGAAAGSAPATGTLRRR